MLGVDENDELIDQVSEGAEYAAKQSFPQMILDNLRTAGVQQAHKDARIVFTALTPWPGELICAEGRYMEGEGASAALGTTLRAETDEAAWASLHGDTSRPFDRPKSGRIAVKVINHLGDEVMKVFRVP
jgi:hypothetical protein